MASAISRPRIMVASQTNVMSALFSFAILRITGLVVSTFGKSERIAVHLGKG